MRIIGSGTVAAPSSSMVNLGARQARLSLAAKMFRVRVDWRRARKYAQNAGTVAAAIPVVTGLGLMAAEKFRRAKFPLDKPFPVTPPQANQIDQNATTVYTYGKDLYDAMLADIAKAQHTIMFESFIWKGDRVGHKFKAALEAAAARGVSVYVIYDGFANLVVPRKFFKFPPEIKVLKFPWIHTSHNVGPIRSSGRDHRKIVVIDGEIGYVGGFNIGDLYATQWRDTHLKIVGPAVWELQNAFVDFWNRWRRGALPHLPVVGTTQWRPTVRAARISPSRMS